MIPVFLLSIGLSYETLQNYFDWHIPLNTIDQNTIYFTDTHIELFEKYSSSTLTSIDYVDDNSIHATFNQNNFFMGDYSIPNEFEFIKTIHEGDKFIDICCPDEQGINYISIMHLISVNATHVIFDHYGGVLPKQIECKYSEIIEHSFDIEWIEFQKTPHDLTGF